jgi:hypothetical protein
VADMTGTSATQPESSKVVTFCAGAFLAGAFLAGAVRCGVVTRR